MTQSTINPFASPAGDADPATFVEADCFRGTTLTGFVDRFRIFGPSERDLASRVVFFYRQARAKVVSDQFPLRFTRGNLVGSLLGPETWALQEIVVHRKGQPQIELAVEYQVRMVLPIRPPTPATLKEVTRLAIELEAINPA